MRVREENAELVVGERERERERGEGEGDGAATQLPHSYSQLNFRAIGSALFVLQLAIALFPQAFRRHAVRY